MVLCQALAIRRVYSCQPLRAKYVINRVGCSSVVQTAAAAAPCRGKAVQGYTKLFWCADFQVLAQKSKHLAATFLCAQAKLQRAPSQILQRLRVDRAPRAMQKTQHGSCAVCLSCVQVVILWDFPEACTTGAKYKYSSESFAPVLSHLGQSLIVLLNGITHCLQ